MQNYRTGRTNVWSVIGIILLIAALVSVVFVLIPKKTDDGFKEINTKWAVGSLENGIYKDDHSLNIVSNYVEIKEGFKVEFDFDKELTVVYYLYDSNKNLVGEVSESYVNSFSLTDFDGAAKYFRLQITVSDDANEHISKAEIYKYSNYITLYRLDEVQENDNDSE